MLIVNKVCTFGTQKNKKNAFGEKYYSFAEKDNVQKATDFLNRSLTPNLPLDKGNIINFAKRKTSVNTEVFLCGRWDLNPHERNAHKILSLARLPVPTLPLDLRHE